MPDVRPGDYGIISTPADYLGLNVYSRVVVSANDTNEQWWTPGDSHPGGNFLVNGMEFYPKSVYDAVQMVSNDYDYTGPIFITENGMSDASGLDDDERIEYVSGFLEWIGRARAEGADIRGYYLWSLLDNYEWAAGFSQKFGIVQVDPDTLDRTPKKSAAWYRDVIATRTLCLKE